MQASPSHPAACGDRVDWQQSSVFAQKLSPQACAGVLICIRLQYLICQQEESSAGPLRHQYLCACNRPQTACRDSWAWQQGPETGQAVLVACCNMLATLLRHRAKGLRRCVALVAASSRKLLQQLAAWLLQIGHCSSGGPNQSPEAPDSRTEPHAECRADGQQGVRSGPHAAEALQPGFKALGRVFAALADQKVDLSAVSCRVRMPVIAMTLARHASAKLQLL